jgi:hypothetical protein
MPENFFLVKIVGDVEPMVSGPFPEETLIHLAREYRLLDPGRNDGLFRMQVTANGQIKMEAFSQTEVGDDDVFVIHSGNEDGFWSNDMGWVEEVVSATYFTRSEMSAGVPLPLSVGNDAAWVPLFQVGVG